MKKSLCLPHAIFILLVLFINSKDTQAQSQPATQNKTDESIPRSKEGNIIVTLPDILYAAQDPTMRVGFKEQTIEIIGQLMPDTTKGVKGYCFKLLRLFEAEGAPKPVPLAISVESAAKPKWAENSWIKVVGTVEFTVQDGKNIALIKARKVEETSQPAEVILY